MLRAILCVGLTVWSGLVWAEPGFPSSAASESSGLIPGRPIDLSAPFRGAMRQRWEDDRAEMQPHEIDGKDSVGSRGLSFGPFQVGGSGFSGGRHRHLASFKLNGVTVFGGSVAGSVDGRSANIVLSWPANP